MASLGKGNVMGEEAMHHFRNSYDKRFTTLVREELATKTELLNYYRALAKSAGSDSKLKEKYEKIARSIEYDIKTIGRYRNIKNYSDLEAEKENEEESELEKKAGEADEKEAEPEDRENSEYHLKKETDEDIEEHPEEAESSDEPAEES